MPINKVYRLIQADLDRVEEKIGSVSDVEFPWQAELLRYCLQTGGKRIRPVLTLLASRFYEYEPETPVLMATAVELMHTATLIHDDAIDKSDIRRGRATINKLWGEETAILLGDYLFARAGEFATDTGNVLVVKLFTRTLQVISSGELNQGRNAFNLNQTREQYIKRIAAKTASLFCLSLESGAILSHAPEKSVAALREYGHDLGVAFQIVDDILDFTSTEAEMGKPIGADLAQGTLTLPAMLILERYPDDNPVRKFFEDREQRQHICQAIEVVRGSSVIRECYQLASEYSVRACQRLDVLPDTPVRQALKDIAGYVVSRKK